MHVDGVWISHTNWKIMKHYETVTIWMNVMTVKDNFEATMKIFQSVQELFLHIYGIGLNQLPFDWRRLLAAFNFSFGIIFICVHFFCEAETFQNFVDSVCVGIPLIGAFIIFIFIQLNKLRIFSSIDEAEQIINRSKLTFQKI